MIRATQIALLVFLIAATAAIGMVAWAAWDAHVLISGASLRVNGKSGILARTEGIEQKAFATLDNLDKATKTWADSAKAQAGSIDDLATDVHGTLSEANTSIQSILPVTAALTDEVGALHKTTDAATGLTQQLTTDARTANDTIEDAQPLLEAYTQSGKDLDVILKDKAIHETFVNLQSATRSGAGILADGKKVADEATRKFLMPVPWWKQPISKGGELIDIGAAIARHTP